MSMNLLQQLPAKVKSRTRPARVVFPEAEDERVLRAASLFQTYGLGDALLVGKRENIEQAISAADLGGSDLTIIDTADNPKAEDYVLRYLEIRPGGNPKVARRLVTRALYHAALMVGAGDADSLVAGAATPTGRVIEAALLGIGLAAGIETPSSFFLMQIPDFLGEGPKDFIYADCAVNVEPDASQLADIAIASASSAQALLREPPRVAMLSFSTQGSAQHAAVEKVRTALAIARDKAPELEIDGEFQADTAIIPRVAGTKLRAPSPVAGEANVLVFPDLNSGNIAYKLTQYMAGANAYGPFLQGFARPLSDLSRGATVDDILNTAAIVVAQMD